MAVRLSSSTWCPAQNMSQVAHPFLTLRRRGVGERIVVVEGCRQLFHNTTRTRLVRHDLGVDHPHKVDHPQVLTLIPGTVIVDGGIRLASVRT